MSPFEQPGGDNSHYALMKRIRDLPCRPPGVLTCTSGAPSTRIAGGWAEVLDAARDAGRPVPQRATRLEQSALLERADVHDLARRADAAVFGAGGVADARVADYWASVHGVRSALLSELPWWRRWAARLSLASLLARRPGSAARTAPPVGAAQ